jgi:drug/metabolite transporter (DMT)-like permease
MLSKKVLIWCGFGWLIAGALLTTINFMAGKAISIDIPFAIAALAIIGFSMAHLAPHFQRKDERFKFIRQKGALFTTILTTIYCGVLWLLTEAGILEIEGKQAVIILLSLISSTLFLSWVVLSKKY